ncbi:pimeloyl-ACP methyl ester carboxylesterase [Chryseobacterium sp. 52]|uniref:alpha/beta fold hydrolase n=1 Tax=Chryseobacterium sp. 52 TaxID=2035213 RepID=UPI000C18861A|nr:alpha/beta hydrolase [Chryseobacterium sp. 52]PIF46637.1 pimeloyl-ACP methyl ester carboxylesterase [Chryseobacterium sp. 52]
MKKLFFLLMLFSLTAVVKSAVPCRQNPIKIDTTEVVKIGGIKQFIKLQGTDETKPLLLFLHGGPGTSLIPVADAFTNKLKEQFVVIQWDQREAGETLKLNHSPEELSLGLLQKDTDELIKYLLKKFNRKKLFLVSHSFGSMLGFNFADKHPELLYAFIPISAIVDQRTSEKLTMDMLNKWAKETNNETAVKELALVKIPFEKEDDLFYSQKWLFIHNGVDFAKEDGFKAKYHEWLAVWFPMWKKSVTNNLFKTLPVLRCPVYFIEGNGDQQKSHYLVEDYYKFVKAPKKGMFWFEKSGHTVFNSEPDKLQQVIIEKILPETF